MLAIALPPVQIDPAEASTQQTAYVALAGAAQRYLRELHRLASSGTVAAGAAVITRVRGTGPGVSFGAILRPLLEATPLIWECPFENSLHVSGAAIRGADVLGNPSRTDGFLVLRFAPGTLDLPLHLHPASDRFIFAIEGRGFFHVSTGSRDDDDDVRRGQIRHVAVRDRDALMFCRGAVHTFSTAEYALTLLSYHQPFIELDDPKQYVVPHPPQMPTTFLKNALARVSFDAGWTCLR